MDYKIKLIIVLVGLFIIFSHMLPSEPVKKNRKDDIIKILLRQAARWALAAEQDSNIMIAVLHANYAAGYLWALKDIATDDEIQKAGNIDILKFKDEITAIQDNITRRMVIICPNYAPDNIYLGRIAGDV